MRMLPFVLTAAALLASPAQATLVIDFVPVGDPGNAADTAVMNDSTTGYGAVPYHYEIGRTEVTNAQYAEFLNAKAASDPLQLYSQSMDGFLGGIDQIGVSGSFTYSLIPGREDWPVNYVSFYDAIRFANWMHNGQGDGDTETGSYTLLGGTFIPSNGDSITRNPGATIVLPSEDEWYKAAYYDAVASSYNPYPFADGFDGAVCEAPAGTTTHSGNCNPPGFGLTPVGAYASSPSAYGTFDQGGNIFELTETIFFLSETDARAVTRGGFWFAPDLLMSSEWRILTFPEDSNHGRGFRIARVAEPGTSLLLMASALGLAVWRRGRA